MAQDLGLDISVIKKESKDKNLENDSKDDVEIGD
jgi:hypothetical protein